MGEGKDPHSFMALRDDCVSQVLQWICQDYTTTRDDLHEKALNYALNYIANHPELSINKEEVAKEVADEVEHTLQKKCFDNRPPASVIAQWEREKIPEEPENKYIKFDK